MKTQYEVKLTGLIQDNSIAKAHQAKEVVSFKGNFPEVHGSGEIRIENNPEGKPIMITAKGSYPLVKSPVQNFYHPFHEIPGIKVHVILKKITGKVIYWA